MDERSLKLGFHITRELAGQQQLEGVEKKQLQKLILETEETFKRFLAAIPEQIQNFPLAEIAAFLVSAAIFNLSTEARAHFQNAVQIEFSDFANLFPPFPIQNLGAFTSALDQHLLKVAKSYLAPEANYEVVRIDNDDGVLDPDSGAEGTGEVVRVFRPNTFFEKATFGGVEPDQPLNDISIHILFPPYIPEKEHSSQIVTALSFEITATPNPRRHNVTRTAIPPISAIFTAIIRHQDPKTLILEYITPNNPTDTTVTAHRWESARRAMRLEGAWLRRPWKG